MTTRTTSTTDYSWARAVAGNPTPVRQAPASQVFATMEASDARLMATFQATRQSIEQHTREFVTCTRALDERIGVLEQELLRLNAQLEENETVHQAKMTALRQRWFPIQNRVYSADRTLDSTESELRSVQDDLNKLSADISSHQYFSWNQ